MYITGYHGTSKENADNILLKQEFQKSLGSKEWLGNGIYFYSDFEDALKWAQMRYDNNGRVIHALIKADEQDILDYDTKMGMKFINTILEAYPCIWSDTAQENQCRLANFIWDTNPNIKVLKSSFPTIPSKRNFIKDFRKNRTELCVRNNENIIFGICQIPSFENVSTNSNEEMKVTL